MAKDMVSFLPNLATFIDDDVVPGTAKISRSIVPSTSQPFVTIGAMVENVGANQHSSDI